MKKLKENKVYIYILISILIISSIVIPNNVFAATEQTYSQGTYFRFYSRSCCVDSPAQFNYGDLNGRSVKHTDSNGNYLYCLDVLQGFKAGSKTVYNESEAVSKGYVTQNQVDRIAIGTTWLKENFPSNKLNGQPVDAVCQIYTWYVRSDYTDWWIVSEGWLNPTTFNDVKNKVVAISNETLMSYFRQADAYVATNKDKYAHESKIFVGSGQNTYLLTKIEEVNKYVYITKTLNINQTLCTQLGIRGNIVYEIKNNETNEITTLNVPIEQGSRTGTSQTIELKKGIYTVTEKSVPDPRIELDTTQKTVNLTGDGYDAPNKAYKISFTNNIKPSVSITKSTNRADLSNKYPITGATFTIYKSNGTTIAKDINGNNAVLVAKADGATNIVVLDPGTYIIKETVVPNGYKKANDITVTINYNEYKKVNIENKLSPGKIKIKKEY